MSALLKQNFFIFNIETFKKSEKHSKGFKVYVVANGKQNYPKEKSINISVNTYILLRTYLYYIRISSF